MKKQIKDMLSYTWYQQQFRAYKSANSLLYYLRKIPLVSHKIPVNIFKSYGFKSFLFYFNIILSIPTRFFAKFFWLALHVGIAILFLNLFRGEPQFTLEQEGMWTMGIVSWCYFIGIANRFLGSFDPFISQPDREFMTHFGLSRTTYFYSRIFLKPVLTSIYYLPALVTFCLLSGQWIFLPLGFLTPMALSFSGQALNRFLFQKGFRYKRNGWSSAVIGISGIIPYFLAFYYRDSLSNQLFMGLAVLLGILILVSLWTLLQPYQLNSYIEFCMDQSAITDKKIAGIVQGNEYTHQGLQMQEKLKLKKGKDLSHLSGMNYLNALLFDRYRTILEKKSLFRVGILVLIFATLELIRFLDPTFTVPAEKGFLPLLPVTFIVMYAGSMGKTIAQMVFVNCDLSMLHYPFYREPQTIIAGFNYRFKQSIFYNARFAVTLFLGLVLFTRATYTPGSYLLTALLLTSLTALFSFHDLFIYYMLQPFTKDMEVTNPVYKFLSGALYWVAYLNSRVDIGSHYYVIGVSCLLLLYVGFGYFFLLKKAPHTFRLKA
ncbi:hypothetical protein [Streptococcus suis]|uniref:hypothetical protein n=1 Tax=Streptococcus suis TaxID=1307 RepID=UPI001EE08033|nr:hypothetical protein [Streptococcus suis]